MIEMRSSTFCRHRAQQISGRMPYACSLSWVFSLPRIASHRINACLGIILPCQTILYHSTTGPLGLLPSQALFTVNLPLVSSTHFTLSLLTLLGLKSLGVALCNSNHTGDRAVGHLQSEPSTIASTFASFPNPEIRIILSQNLQMRGPTGCQLSYHKEMDEPSPTWYLIFSREICLSLRIFLQAQEQSPGIFISQKLLFRIKCVRTQHDQTDWSPSVQMCHKCLIMAARFQCSILLMPSPPSSLGRQTCSHATLAL